MNSVLSILADASNRETLDRDMSATITDRIDGNFNSVDDYLGSNVSNPSNSPIPKFITQKKRANELQNKQPLKRPTDEGMATVNYEFTGTIPHSEHSYQGSNDIYSQHHDIDRNSVNNEPEIAPNLESHYEDLNEYGDDDYDEDYDDDDHNSYEPQQSYDNYDYYYGPQPYNDYDHSNYDPRSYVGPQNETYGNFYNNHNYRTIKVGIQKGNRTHVLSNTAPVMIITTNNILLTKIIINPIVDTQL